MKLSSLLDDDYTSPTMSKKKKKKKEQTKKKNSLYSFPCGTKKKRECVLKEEIKHSILRPYPKPQIAMGTLDPTILEGKLYQFMMSDAYNIHVLPD